MPGPEGGRAVDAGPAARSVRPLQFLRGLSPRDAERPSGDYFDRFPWEPPLLDAERMSARDFLDAL